MRSCGVGWICNEIVTPPNEWFTSLHPIHSSNLSIDCGRKSQATSDKLWILIIWAPLIHTSHIPQLGLSRVGSHSNWPPRSRPLMSPRPNGRDAGNRIVFRKKKQFDSWFLVVPSPSSQVGSWVPPLDSSLQKLTKPSESHAFVPLNLQGGGGSLWHTRTFGMELFFVLDQSGLL